MRFLSSLAVFSGLLLGCAAWPVLAQEIGAPPVAMAQDAPPNNAPPVAPAPANNAERAISRRAQNEMLLRATMRNFGIEEVASQDALVAYLAEDEAGKSAVRGAARRLMAAVRTETPTARMRDLIAIYKAAIDADRERRRAAQDTLDAKIGFSLNPRLEATLWLLGVLGEGQSGGASWRPPRAPAPREAKKDDKKDEKEAARPRGGTILGVVMQKTSDWLEVQSEKAEIARYFAPEPENRAPAARAIADDIAGAAIGQRVRLQWAWDDGRRVVKLEFLPPVAPVAAPENAENPLPEPAPIPELAEPNGAAPQTPATPDVPDTQPLIP